MSVADRTSLYEPSLDEARFRALAEASPAAIFIAQNGRITYANPMLAAVTGLTPDELIGMDFAALVHPADRAAVEARREDRARGDEADAHDEVRIATRTNDERWIDLTTAQIVYDGGAAIVGTGIDITTRKRLERRMQQLRGFEALGRLAGGVAHDFNNLLMVISGEAERLREGLGDDPPRMASVDAIATAASRAASLTRQLLAFGRRQMLVAQLVDVNQVLLDLPSLLGDAPDTVFRLAPQLPPVRADRTHLEQALINLVCNAREAMTGGGTLTVVTDVVEVDAAMREGRPWLPGGSWVRIQMTDTGRGIPADVLPHVFEPFFSTKQAGPATGLGLSTVYGIVKQSGGYVWIDSEPGAGARVTVLLPPSQPSSAPPAPAPAAPAAEAHVLLVEDEHSVRQLLVSMLRRNGFAVTDVASAEAAVEALAGSRFDLLLTDVVLPGMNGVELARLVRRQCPDTRVLLMSGYTGVRDGAEFADERTFLQKPFGSRTLMLRLRALLAERA